MSALGVKRTSPIRAPMPLMTQSGHRSTIASRGPHKARIYERMEGQDLAARLTAENRPSHRHHQPLAFSLRR